MAGRVGRKQPNVSDDSFNRSFSMLKCYTEPSPFNYTSRNTAIYIVLQVYVYDENQISVTNHLGGQHIEDMQCIYLEHSKR